MKSWWETNHTAPESGRRGTCCCSCKTAPSMQSESRQWLPRWLEQNIRPPMTPSRRNLSSPSSSFPLWFFSPYHWRCLRWGNWQIGHRPGQSRGRRWSVCRTCPAGICPSALAGRTGPAAVLLLHLCGAVNNKHIPIAVWVKSPITNEWLTSKTWALPDLTHEIQHKCENEMYSVHEKMEDVGKWKTMQMLSTF